MNYMCPVCGYPRLIAPPKDYMICPSCGTEFGNDDFAATHEGLRHAWLTAGAFWFSRHTLPPPDWNPITQLLRAGLGYKTTTEHALLRRASVSAIGKQETSVNIQRRRQPKVNISKVKVAA